MSNQTTVYFKSYEEAKEYYEKNSNTPDTTCYKPFECDLLDQDGNHFRGWGISVKHWSLD